MGLREAGPHRSRDAQPARGQERDRSGDARGAAGTFCAGADLKSYVPLNYIDATPARVREIVELGLGGLTRGMPDLSKPVIAAVDGWALAGGPERALACNLVTKVVPH